MLDVHIVFDDVILSNIEREDLDSIQKWMDLEPQLLGEEFNFDELQERFLESYISECEFFLKVKVNNEIVGILKGRLEFKNPNEAWIWFFYLNNQYRDTELGKRIIEKLTEYFYNEYGVNLFFTRTMKSDAENISFWKNIGFDIIRIVKNFYKINDKEVDMFIMKR